MCAGVQWCREVQIGADSRCREVNSAERRCREVQRDAFVQRCKGLGGVDVLRCICRCRDAVDVLRCRGAVCRCSREREREV
jgi:hypothetical protein